MLGDRSMVLVKMGMPGLSTLFSSFVGMISISYDLVAISIISSYIGLS